MLLTPPGFGKTAALVSFVDALVADHDTFELWDVRSLGGGGGGGGGLVATDGCVGGGGGDRGLGCKAVAGAATPTVALTVCGLRERSSGDRILLVAHFVEACPGGRAASVGQLLRRIVAEVSHATRR